MTTAEMLNREAHRLSQAFLNHLMSDDHREVCIKSCLVLNTYAVAYCGLQDAAKAAAEGAVANG